MVRFSLNIVSPFNVARDLVRQARYHLEPSRKTELVEGLASEVEVTVEVTS